MKIGILQPGYLPWLGFFEQMYRTDVFVIYDDVQYDKNGWRNRNRIKTPNGSQWLTIPINIRFSERPLINEIRIGNDSIWRKKHLLSIRQNYSKAPFCNRYIAMFEKCYAGEWSYLIDVQMYFIRKLAECLGMGEKKIVTSSSLEVKGDRIERLIKICKVFGADVFYEGAAGKNYINLDYFYNSGIKVEFQDYRHPRYTQLYGDFIPNLSVIDLLFNHGEKSLSILTGECVAKGESD